MYRILTVAILIPSLAAAQDKPATFTPTEVDKLIEQLDSKQFREREQASRKLLSLDEVPPALEAATKSSHPETARRAALIVEQIQERVREKQVQRELARINQTGVDFFLDRMVLDKKFATADRWRMTARLVDSIAARASTIGYGGCSYPRSNWPELPLVTELPVRGTHVSRVAIDAGGQGGVGLPGARGRATLFNSLVVGTGTFGRLGYIDNSIVLIDCDLPSANRILNSVVICKGDIGPIQEIHGSIILATGKLGSTTFARNSFFETASLGTTRATVGNVYVNVKPIDGADLDKNKFVQSKEGPLTMLKWFDPAALGLKVTHIDGEARVDGLVDGKPFAKSALQTGDVIQLIDGRGWVDADHFVRELRRALARDSATLRVKRGGKVEDIPVRLAE